MGSDITLRGALAQARTFSVFASDWYNENNPANVLNFSNSDIETHGINQYFCKYRNTYMSQNLLEYFDTLQ